MAQLGYNIGAWETDPDVGSAGIKQYMVSEGIYLTTPMVSAALETVCDMTGLQAACTLVNPPATRA